MARLSIYEAGWIDLVFENRNKEYGAYQLRRDSVKNSFTALFMGLLFVTSLGVIVKLSSYLNPNSAPIITTPEWSEPLDVTRVHIQEDEKPLPTTRQQQASQATILKDQLINPIIVHSIEATVDIATNKENQYAGDIISEGTASSGSTTSGQGKSDEVTSAIDYENTVVSTTLLDKKPEFPGGISKFYNYVGNNFEKPELDESISYKIYVSFVIERDGSMTDIKVIKDPGFGLGQEAIRVLKSLKTKWSPGMIGSNPVRTAYNLPIAIKME